MSCMQRARSLPRNEAPSKSWGSLGPAWPSTKCSACVPSFTDKATTFAQLQETCGLPWPSGVFSTATRVQSVRLVSGLVTGPGASRASAGECVSKSDFLLSRWGVERLGMRSSFPEKYPVGHSRLQGLAVLYGSAISVIANSSGSVVDDRRSL